MVCTHLHSASQLEMENLVMQTLTLETEGMLFVFFFLLESDE